MYVYACMHTFGVLIMLKINRAKRSDDAQPQQQKELEQAKSNLPKYFKLDLVYVYVCVCECV